jgi:CHAD domain-containing protein
VLWALTRDRKLDPVALVRTHRAVHRLRSGDGSVLAEVTDDRVTAQSPPDGSDTPRSWREWEVELVDADTDFLADVAACLGEAGALPAQTQSKLMRALGDRAPKTASVADAAPFRQGVSAVAVLRHRLCELVTQLRGYDPLVRADAPDAVHKMRVAIRRLRSALATYRPLLDREVTDPLRVELKWLGGVLGDARDAEVLREKLLADVGELPPEEVRGGVREFIDRELMGAYRRDQERATESMSTNRYLGLLDRLDALVDDPPWREGAIAEDVGVLRQRVRHDWKRLAHRTAALDDLPGDEYAAGLHEVRKAAKRARYAAEPLVQLDGKDAKRFVKALKGLQASLGRHQDSVVAHERLGSLADRAAAAGVNAFTFGRLQSTVEAEAAEEQAGFPEMWQRVSRRKLRRWTKRPA